MADAPAPSPGGKPPVAMRAAGDRPARGGDRGPLPAWAAEVAAQYESGATSQFLCFGNVHDRMLLPLGGGKSELGSLTDFLVKALLGSFEVVLSFDLGSGLRVEKGGEAFMRWPRIKNAEIPALPRAPREAVELLSAYVRYCANLARLGQERIHVACLIRGAELLAPGGWSGNWESSAIACQLRDWASDAALAEHTLATFLIADNLADLHPLVANNPRAAQVKVPLPDAAELERALEHLAPSCALAIGAPERRPRIAAAFSGATLASVEALLRRRQHEGQPLSDGDLAGAKKAMVEKDCNGLIEFIDAKRTLADVHGQEALKRWLRQDIALWKAGDLEALPKGYLLCGPVGTGKTYLVECLAGEAGVPVVKLKNFRDKWVGSTEGNLEKIFRLIHALGRAFVFIDEADQALGKRDSGAGDGGIGGRIYGMMAEEMSSPRNRGRIVWILASSRPDLIEVDLKRPGRVDVKVPIFPTTEPEESWALLRALCKRRGVELADADRAALLAKMPLHLTPGAAEALAVKVYRQWRTAGTTPAAALAGCLEGYQSPVPPSVMDFQIGLAVDEATDLEFVPPALRKYGSRGKKAD